MNARLTVLILMLPSCPVLAPEKADPADELIDSVEEWLQENFDDNALQALGQIDRPRARQFLAELEKRFAGTSLYDLGDLKEDAARWLALLQQFEETRPYAVWLQTHFDYFDSANEMRRRMVPVPPEPDKPVPRPPIEVQRTVWKAQLEKRSPPARAQNYLPQLRRIFAEEKVPLELVWLAEVESSFDPKALSPAGGAGLFQLMPRTARGLGLSAVPEDERFQPEKNARAAAQHLRHLRGHFGDWPLALAAYNTGETRVDNLLKRSETRTFEAIAHRLPAETQLYVPKVEATLRRREGRELADLKSPR